MANRLKKKIKSLAAVLLTVSAIASLYVLSGGSAPTFGSENIIASGISWPRDIFPIDIDLDGDMDVFTVRQSTEAETPNDFTGWYENNSDGTWSFHAIDDPSGMTVYGADMDGDGYPELVVTRYRLGRLDLYNCGGHPEGVWTRTALDATFGIAYICLMADMDNDNDLDVVAVAYNDNLVAWFENNAMVFTEHTVVTNMQPRGLAVADIDGDGWNDTITDYQSQHLRWYKNDGTPSNGGWAINFIADDLNAVTVSCADVDGDSDIDIICPHNIELPAYTGKFHWIENTLGDGSAWTLHTIDTGLYSPRIAYPVDLDSDGDIDIIGAIEAPDGASGGIVKWYENTLGDGSTWSAHVLTSSFAGGATDCNAADMDGDGDIDVLACDKGLTQSKDAAPTNDGSFVWFELEGTPPVTPNDGPVWIAIDGKGNNSITYTSVPVFIWSNVSGAVSYELQIANDSGFTLGVVTINYINELNYPVEYSDNATSISFLLPGASQLVYFRDYYARVRALT